MTMDPMEDFLYHLKKYMEYTTEMRSSYEHLTAEQKEKVIQASPAGKDPEVLSKHAYTWHDKLFTQNEMDKKR